MNISQELIAIVAVGVALFVNQSSIRTRLEDLGDRLSRIEGALKVPYTPPRRRRGLFRRANAKHATVRMRAR